jgi:hypothetical protein
MERKEDDKFISFKFKLKKSIFDKIDIHKIMKSNKVIAYQDNKYYIVYTNCFLYNYSKPESTIGFRVVNSDKRYELWSKKGILSEFLKMRIKENEL